MADQKPVVGIIMGSKSDLGVMEGCTAELEALGVPYELVIASAHRTPAKVHEWASTAADRGIKVIIAAAGKAVKKKDLAQIAMTYGYVYVASISMGANKQQTLKALKEAEAYKGPSLIIAYAPCINQGIRKGMGKSMEEGKLAVDSGYWPLYRFNPELAEQGKAPLTLESKAPDGTLRDFLAGENRYAQLKSIAPQDSERLQNDLEKAYNDRYQLLKYMAAFSGSAEQPKAAEEPKVTE